LNDGTEIAGEMTEANDDYFCVLPIPKKKKKPDKTAETEPLKPIPIHYDNQKETKIILTF
jgi:hypothetical protein